MGQRPDEVRDYGRITAQSEEASSSADSRAAGSEHVRSGDEVERTRSEIERTRADMSETIDAIQEKVSPQNLKEQAKEQAKGRAKGMGSTIKDTIRENPLPAAVAGIGLGWLFMSGRKQGSHQQPRYREVEVYAYQYPPYYETARHEQQGSSSGASAGQALSGAESKAGQAASQAEHRAEQAAGQVRDRASQLGDRAEHQTQRAKGTLERMLHENPLAVGALAVGAGSAVGLAIPETAKENQVMGETRDSLAHKAQQKAQEIKPKVERVAKEAQSAAKDEAKDQGLTGEGG